MTAKTKLFLSIFHKAERKYSRSSKRLAAEGWENDWQTLIATIYSAQSRDETTIPVMEKAFNVFPTLESYANSPFSRLMSLTKKINYYKTKSKHSKKTAQELISKFNSQVPGTIESLVTLPGVGRKTANLIITKVHNKEGICVDTHVQRISNVLGIVKTKTPHQTELELQKIAPKKYWGKINRIFVLWGKEVPGRSKQKLVNKLNNKTLSSYHDTNCKNIQK